MISNFLTVAAVQGIIAFTHTPHTPLKTDEKCCQTAELGFAKCNFQNLDKKYSAYGVHTKRLFLPSKAEMNACRCHETGLIPVLFSFV